MAVKTFQGEFGAASGGGSGENADFGIADLDLGGFYPAVVHRIGARRQQRDDAPRGGRLAQELDAADMTFIPSGDFQTAEFRKVAVLEQFDFPVDIGNVQMRQTEDQMAAFFDKADQFPVERFIHPVVAEENQGLVVGKTIRECRHDVILSVGRIPGSVAVAEKFDPERILFTAQQTEQEPAVFRRPGFPFVAVLVLTPDIRIPDPRMAVILSVNDAEADHRAGFRTVMDGIETDDFAQDAADRFGFRSMETVGLVGEAVIVIMPGFGIKELGAGHPGQIEGKLPAFQPDLIELPAAVPADGDMDSPGFSCSLGGAADRTQTQQRIARHHFQIEDIGAAFRQPRENQTGIGIDKGAGSDFRPLVFQPFFDKINELPVRSADGIARRQTGILPDGAVQRVFPRPVKQSADLADGAAAHQVFAAFGKNRGVFLRRQIDAAPPFQGRIAVDEFPQHHVDLMLAEETQDLSGLFLVRRQRKSGEVAHFQADKIFRRFEPAGDRGSDQGKNNFLIHVFSPSV